VIVAASVGGADGDGKEMLDREGEELDEFERERRGAGGTA
jgi:hypothetical protein